MIANNFAKKHGFKPMFSLDKTRHLDVARAAIRDTSVYRYIHDLTGQVMLVAECNGKTIDRGRDFAGNGMGVAYKIYDNQGAYDLAYQNWSLSGELHTGDVRIVCAALQDLGIAFNDDNDEYPESADFYS